MHAHNKIRTDFGLHRESAECFDCVDGETYQDGNDAGFSQ